MHECFNYFFGLTDRIIQHYDPVKVFSFNYWLYICSGFWKYQSIKWWITTLYKCYNIGIILFYAASMTLFVVDAIIVREDMNKLSFNMSSSVLVFMKMMQIALLSHARENVVDINDKLNNHLYLDTVGHSDKDKDIFKEKAQKAIALTITFYSLLAIGLPLRVIADTALDTRAYIIPIPFKDKLEPFYAYLYAQQVFGTFHFMATTLAFDLLEFTFILRFIGHYDVLEKNISKIKTVYKRPKYENYVRGYLEASEQTQKTQLILVREANYPREWTRSLNEHRVTRFSVFKWAQKEKSGEEEVLRLLKQNINHHQRLLVVLKNFLDIYSRPLLIQVFGLLILIGILILQLLFLTNELLSPLFMQQMVYALTVVMNILYLSSFGSELASKSLSIANTLYDTPWYDMSIKNRKTVRLILQRLMKAPNLKGGNMINIDRPMCVKFFQFCYNMVTLLRKRI